MSSAPSPPRPRLTPGGPPVPPGCVPGTANSSRWVEPWADWQTPVKPGALLFYGCNPQPPREKRITTDSAAIANWFGAHGGPLTPRQRVAKLLEAVGLGDYEPETIAELHVRDRFAGRPPSPRQREDARRFEDLMHVSHWVEIYGLDVPLDSYSRVFDALDLEQIEEALLLYRTMRRLVREAERRVCAIAERPWVYDARPGARGPNRQTADRTSPRDRERGQRCSERTRGSRRCSTGSSGGGDPHQSGDEPPGEHHLGHRRPARGRR